jgi:hypothetical protein
VADFGLARVFKSRFPTFKTPRTPVISVTSSAPNLAPAPAPTTTSSTPQLSPGQKSSAEHEVDEPDSLNSTDFFIIDIKEEEKLLQQRSPLQQPPAGPAATLSLPPPAPASAKSKTNLKIDLSGLSPAKPPDISRRQSDTLAMAESEERRRASGLQSESPAGADRRKSSDLTLVRIRLHISCAKIRDILAADRTSAER